MMSSQEDNAEVLRYSQHAPPDVLKKVLKRMNRDTQLLLFNIERGDPSNEAEPEKTTIMESQTHFLTMSLYQMAGSCPENGQKWYYNKHYRRCRFRKTAYKHR